MFSKKNNISRYKFNTQEPFDFYSRRFYDIEGREYCYGWKSFVDQDTPEGLLWAERFQPIKLQINKRTVPAKLLNEEYIIALKALIKQNEEIDEDTGEVLEEYAPSKTQTKELKSAIKNKLLRETKPVPSFVDVVFDMVSGICYVFSTNKKELGFFEEIASEQMELILMQLGGFLINEDSNFKEEDFHEVMQYICEHELFLSETMDVKFKEGDSSITMTNAAEESDISINLARGYVIKELGLCGMEEFKVSDFYGIKAWGGPEIIFDKEDIEATIMEKMETVKEQFKEIDECFKGIWEKLYE